MDLGLLGAFLGGVLTLLSPCSVMLLPAFFSYAFTDPRTIVERTGVFYLGLITTLVPLGVLAGSLGALVNRYRTDVVTVASVVVILLGLLMLLGVQVPGLRRGVSTGSTTGVGVSTGSTGAAGATGANTSTFAVYALGTVYGLAGVCAGPLLGAALTFAALGGSALYGGVVLLVFAAGMALPLLLLALLWGRLPFVRRLVRPREISVGPWRNTWTGVVGGVLTIAVGVLLLLTEGTATLGGVLGAPQQFRLESWVMETTGSVPDVAVIVVVAVLAAGAWWLLRRRRRLRAGQASSDALSSD
ncbi:Cytochrome c biogenesis protein CcdA [Paraoerskovia marina]|uniref:Cytochrome c biogenesis protein CcdA n=1 Tax=Paraoerskovia marina TaxID=545619 RepID=A0A1H1NRV2_9CELL|nr:cytochrome c biogenesis protein CcdA [Paraoerskovia marina]SDS01495.1 Cytochrome c biogenesis protein CcdA [Paraoerskovia marina]